jgi:hypothetical protein
MLEDVLAYIHNRFEVGESTGTFTVSDGTLDAGGQEGQYVWVEGSVFNDGLHQVGDTDLADEEFTGRVVFLAVPKAVVSIAEEAAAWVEANADALGGAYKSESFGGYTYTKDIRTNADGSGQAEWQAKFGPRLRRWRKLYSDWS